MYARNLPALPREHIPTRIAYISQGSVIEQDAKDVIDLLFKAQLYNAKPAQKNSSPTFQLREDVAIIPAIDSVLVSRILHFCHKGEVHIHTGLLKELTYGEYDKARFDQVMKQAQQRLPQEAMQPG